MIISAAALASFEDTGDPQKPRAAARLELDQQLKANILMNEYEYGKLLEQKLKD
jgi:hypothetical protein